jgi:DGQHR domain-containing protein
MSFYTIPVIEVKQLDKEPLYLAAVQFKILRQIMRFTARQESSDNPIEEVVHSKINEDYYQRDQNTARLAKLVNFIKDKEIPALFPTALLISLDAKDTDTYKPDSAEFKEWENAIDTDPTYCIITKDSNGHLHLCIPENNGIALIMDGQHRLKAFEKYYTTLTTDAEKISADDFEFPVSFVVGLELFQQGQIFAKVNFEQKSVNRSIFIDIFGSSPEDKYSDIRFQHELILFLNNDARSPLNGMVKLLGRGAGLVSQAFLAERIRPLLKTTWTEELISYMAKTREYKRISIFLLAYFSAIKEQYSKYWPQKKNVDGKDVYKPANYPHILCKTLGMGAFFKLIGDIYPKIKGDIKLDNYLANKDTEVIRVKGLIMQNLPKLSETETKSDEKGNKLSVIEYYLGAGGPFSKGSSEGQVKRLYEGLKNLLPEK